MKNSNELCHPLCLPFECYGIDTQRFSLTGDTFVHYYAEMILLREGHLRVVLDQEELLLSPGEALVVCPGVKHSVLLEGDESVRMDLLRMDPDRMPPLPDYSADLKSILVEACRQRMPMVLSAPEAERLGLTTLCACCVRESQERAYGYDLSVACQLALISVALIRYWLSKGLTLGDRELQTDPIYSLTGYIQAHLRDGLRVEDLAAYCGLSYPWFAKKFREIYGISCKDYIEQIRVAQVEQYLLFTEMDLTRISEATGYADCSHMIKNFKRIMDITPGQYRLKRR